MLSLINLDNLYEKVYENQLDMFMPLKGLSITGFIKDQIYCLNSKGDPKKHKRKQRCLLVSKLGNSNYQILIDEMLASFETSIPEFVYVYTNEQKIKYITDKQSEIEVEYNADINTPWTNFNGTIAKFKMGDAEQIKKCIDADFTNRFCAGSNFYDNCDIYHISIKWVNRIRCYLAHCGFLFEGIKVLLKGGMNIRNDYMREYPKNFHNIADAFSVGDTDTQILFTKANYHLKDDIIAALFKFSEMFMDDIWEDVKDKVNVDLLEDYHGLSVKSETCPMFHGKIVDNASVFRYSKKNYPVKVQCNELKFGNEEVIHFDLFRWKIPVSINGKSFAAELLDISLAYDDDSRFNYYNDNENYLKTVNM